MVVSVEIVVLHWREGVVNKIGTRIIVSRVKNISWPPYCTVPLKGKLPVAFQARHESRSVLRELRRVPRDSRSAGLTKVEMSGIN